MNYDLILENANVFTTNNKFEILNIGIANEKIKTLSPHKILPDSKDCAIFDCKNLHIIPGVIDTQVHFREPGLEHKEDLESGTRAALMGGVTAVFEMPNTKPSTTSKEAIEYKVQRTKDRIWCDIAFYVGANASNIEQLPELEQLAGVCGTKIFMGSSTGDLLLYQKQALHKIFSQCKRNIALHCEDEERLISRKTIAEQMANAEAHPIWRDEESAFLATQMAIEIAEQTNRKVHILHISSKKEIEFLKNKKQYCTIEVLPQHLILQAPECYQELGTLAQMNPPIRSKEHRSALLYALKNNIFDLVGSDHAPHTLTEKQQVYPKSPSGMPGVQNLLSILLDLMNQGEISAQQLVNYTSLNAIQIFGIKRGPITIGQDANFSIVDLKKTDIFKSEQIESKCGWSPYTGKSFTGWANAAVIHGKMCMWEGVRIEKASGRLLAFNK